jgi:hypothetical protein
LGFDHIERVLEEVMKEVIMVTVVFRTLVLKTTWSVISAEICFKLVLGCI